ncbi:serine/threonine kinase with two-component sensor domain, partial [Plesiocystis pacifica SIR-1]
MEVGGYRGTDIVRESLRSVVWRGLRRSDGRPVVIKTPAPHLAPAQVRARFRNEWLIAQLVDAPELVEVLELIDEPTALALVFADDDPELRALDEHALAQPPDTAACVRVALAVLDALTHLHAKSVVHKDIKPSNVLVNPDYGRAVLIDFGISAVLPRELRWTTGARIEGTLGYMPPEQTGRIDRAVDYRSDYYSLGATLYWLLTGERLFPELREASELIHAQLTRVPPLAHERAPERRLPPVLSRVVAKLLRKSADERYQGSHGLRQDLRRILDALEGPGEVPEFAIASRDPSERLRPPQRLYGRDTQRARLLELHRQARPSAPSLARVRGPSGSGKSALLDDLRSALTQEGASSVFSVRKFDQYSQADPRTGLGRILEGMLVAVRDHPEVPERALAGAMAEAMGANASLLRPLVPSLGPMLDALAPRPEATSAPPSVGPAEQRDRFWDTVEGFVEVLRRAPVAQVLVLDDVQWADATSLRLVELLVRPSPADAPER